MRAHNRLFARVCRCLSATIGRRSLPRVFAISLAGSSPPSPQCVRRHSFACAIVAAASFASCAIPRKNYDYQAYLEHMPRSILVLPPLEEVIDVGAGAACLSRVSRPLAERGYYVFPVAVVEAMMKENGLPTAGEMHHVSLRKLDEVFAADAVMYITLKEWGTSYHVIDSATVVTIEARLVDVKTGVELWRGVKKAQAHSSGGLDPIGMLVAALMTQVVSSSTDQSRELSASADRLLFYDPDVGLLPGPYDPRRDVELKDRGLMPK